MNFSYTVVFVVLSLHCVISAPAKKSMYDAITEKCPHVKLVPNYKNQKLFESCKNWEVISEVDKLTSDNHDEIRCLLYFQTFTSYCTHFKEVNVTIPKNVIMKYDINMICNYTKTIPHKNLSAVFATEANCQSVCLDEIGYINSVCGVSYHLHSLVDGLQNGLSQSNASNNSDFMVQKVKPDDSRLDTKHAAPEHPLFVDSHISENVDEKNPADPNIVGPPDHSTLQDQDIAGAAAQAAHAANTVNIPAIQQLQNEDQTKPHNEEGNPPVKAPVAPAVGDKPHIQSHDDKEDTQSEANLVEMTSNGMKKKQENVDEIGQNPQKDAGNDEEIQEIPIDRGDEQMEVSDNGQESGDQEETMGISQNIVPVEKNSKSVQGDNTEAVNYSTEMEGDSYFFTYFMILCIIFIAGYVCYHNKQKILALILEGRRGKRQYRGRRPNSANYHKLDSNLEEAINSSCKKNTNNVIY